MNFSFSISKVYLLYRLGAGFQEAFFMFIIFIFTKELNVNLLKITALTTVKPLVGIVSYYLNVIASNKKLSLFSFLKISNFLAGLFSLAIAVSNSSGGSIMSYIGLMVCVRSSLPVWSEILKNSLKKSEVVDLVGLGNKLGYTIIIFFPILLGYFFDQSISHWKVFFSMASALFFLKVILITKMKFKEIHFQDHRKKPKQWHYFYSLIKQDKSFRSYLFLFFIGGISLVTLQPLLPVYYKNTLKITYLDFGLAVGACKGGLFLISNDWWIKCAKFKSLFYLNFYVNFFTLIFIVLLFMAQYNICFLHLAFAFYGMMQAGSELSYQMSGIEFSKEKTSIDYSSINLLCIGFRGVFCFLLSYFLQSNLSSPLIIILGIGLSILSLSLAYFFKDLNNDRDLLRENYLV